MRFDLAKGFTLIELLIAFFIIGILSVFILNNFRGGQAEATLTRAIAMIESDIRRTQNLAIAVKEFAGTIPCGYGIKYKNNRHYQIYVGKRGGATNCQLTNHNFEPNIDQIYEDDIKIIEKDVVFKNSFSDIFFEPPDPTTYINNQKSLGISTTIEICLETDLTKCKKLIIETGGKITIQ